MLMIVQAKRVVLGYNYICGKLFIGGIIRLEELPNLEVSDLYSSLVYNIENVLPVRYAAGS